jgi:hypothetical protein
MNVRVRTIALCGILGPAILAGGTAPIRAQQADSTKPAAAPPKDTISAKPMRTKQYGTIPARFQFGIGGYLPQINTSAQLSTAHLPGTDINLSKTLGLTPNNQSIDLYAQWRFKQRHVLSAEFFTFNRSASRTITDSLIVNDTIYHAGATIDTKNGIQYYGLTYRYYIWRRERWELGAGLGIDVMDLSASFGVKASVNGQADSAQVKGSIVAPVPMIGIYADWEMIPRLYLRGTFQTLYIANVQSYGGAVRDRRIAAEWYPFHNFGFGLGWHYVGLDIKKTQPNGAYIKLSNSIQGLSLYATAAFGPAEPVPHQPPGPRSEPPAGQDFGLVPKTISFSLGGYLPSVQSQGQLSTALSTGDRIDLESGLGLPSNTSSVNLGAQLRIANKSLLTFTYFSFTRDGSKTLSDTIHFGGGTYDPGATINAGGTLSYFGFTYRYYLWRERKWQVGFGLGLDEIEAATHVGIKASIAGKEDSLQHHGSLSTPAPMLGLYADWEVFHAFYARLTGQWLGGTISSYNFNLTDDRLDLEYYFFKNYGLGAGYHYVGFSGGKTFNNGDKFEMKYTVQGPVMYVTAAF